MKVIIKKPKSINKLAILILMILPIIVIVGQSPMQLQLAARRTIAALLQEIETAQQTIQELYRQDLKVKTIMGEIAQLKTQIDTLKNQTSIASLESQLNGLNDQLNLGAVTIWVNSVDPETQVNLNKKINSALNAIFLNDDFIKEKMQKVSMHKREIAERIGQKGWVGQIQKLGAAIEAAAPAEIKQITTSLTALNAATAQIVTLRNNPTTDAQISPLEIELIKKMLTLKGALTQNPDAHKQILLYDTEFKKISLILEFMQNPSKAKSISQEALANFDELTNESLL